MIAMLECKIKSAIYIYNIDAELHLFARQSAMIVNAICRYYDIEAPASSTIMVRNIRTIIGLVLTYLVL